MSTWFRFGRSLVAGILVAVVVALGAGRASAQGMSNTEVVADAVPQAPPPPPAASPDKFSGLMFGDYYYFKSDNQSAFDTQQGFWLRRVYFTYDHAFSPAVSTRFRLEANSNGKMTAPTTSIKPYVKDAWVKWAYAGKHALSLGIVGTVAIEDVEAVYGLRHIEKTPIDLYRIDSSRDFGASASGPLNQANTLQYSVQFGNDSGNSSEIDKYKAFRFAARYVTNPGFVAEGFYGYYYKPAMANRTTGQIFVGYQTPQGRAGFQYVHHNRTPAENTANPEVTINIYSGFGIWNVKPSKLSIFARLDKSDANPDALGIDYLPIYNKAPFTMGVVGIEYYIHPSVRFSPNVEWVTYGDPVSGAAAPTKNDTVLRCTFFWTW